MVVRDLRPLRGGGFVTATVYTVGHSTRSQDELLALLAQAGVRAIADVRAFPSSRRHPQFNRGSLEGWLPENQVQYVWIPELGGRRSPVAGSPNGAWRETAFQGYADHMSTAEFAGGLAVLERLAREQATAVMCAEALWWRCHRRLIADGLTVRGWRVEHLGAGSERVLHELPEFALVSPDGTITYPPAQPSLLDA